MCNICVSVLYTFWVKIGSYLSSDSQRDLWPHKNINITVHKEELHIDGELRYSCKWQQTQLNMYKQSRNILADITDKVRGGSASDMASSRSSNSVIGLDSPSLRSVSICFALFSSPFLVWILKQPHSPSCHRGQGNVPTQITRLGVEERWLLTGKVVLLRPSVYLCQVHRFTLLPK